VSGGPAMGKDDGLRKGCQHVRNKRITQIEFGAA
jgi:hypothetical protein